MANTLAMAIISAAVKPTMIALEVAPGLGSGVRSPRPTAAATEKKATATLTLLKVFSLFIFTSTAVRA